MSAVVPRRQDSKSLKTGAGDSIAMIISRTPYRISFFGGGTDYPAWYRRHGGGGGGGTLPKKFFFARRGLAALFLGPFLLRFFVFFSGCFHPLIHPPAGRAGVPLLA